MHDQRKVKEDVGEEVREERRRQAVLFSQQYLSVLARRDAHDYSIEALKATTDVLLINPEAYSLYNYRRSICIHLWTSDKESSGHHMTQKTRLKDELLFNTKILNEDFKVYAAFVHRHWIFDVMGATAREEVNNLMSGFASGSTAPVKCDEEAAPGKPSPSGFDTLECVAPMLHFFLTCLQKEKDQCETLLKLDERNFHAWNYRRWALQQLDKAGSMAEEVHRICLERREASCADDDKGSTSCFSLYTPKERKDLDFTTAKINRNFSNYSAWHQRGLVIRSAIYRAVSKCRGHPALGASFRADLQEQLWEDAQLLIKAMFCDPNDQSAWFYAPFVLQLASIYCAPEAGRAECVSATKSSGPCKEKPKMTGDVMDAFVEAAVELIAEEVRLKEDHECHLPFYFLFSILTSLRGVTEDAHVRDQGLESLQLCPPTAEEKAELQANQLERRMRYVRLVSNCLYADGILSSFHEQEMVCLVRLRDHLVRADPLRKGMYESLAGELGLP